MSKCKNHPDRRMLARGMCGSCYSKWRSEKGKKKPEQGAPTPKQDSTLLRELLNREKKLKEIELAQDPRWKRYWACVEALKEL